MTKKEIIFTFHYVSILMKYVDLGFQVPIAAFTFHYVSILIKIIQCFPPLPL